MDRITLSSMRYEGRLGATEEERAFPQMVEVDLDRRGRPARPPAHLTPWPTPSTTRPSWS